MTGEINRKNGATQMFDGLKRLNAAIPFHQVEDAAFSRYGRVITDFDAGEIIRAAETIARPAEGSAYVASEKTLEETASAAALRAVYAGELPAEIGYCHGHNSFLNAAEWHNCNEINIAVTPFVLLLASKGDMRDGRLESSDFQAFLVPRGCVIEVYSSTLHFCPCEVSKDGFGCVVVLSEGTNLPLDRASSDPMLFRKNKWIVGHEKNAGLLARGVKPGIGGDNIRIRYAGDDA